MSMENQNNNPAQIIEDLKSDDSDVVRSAAFAAGEMKLEEAIPLLCECVQQENLGIQEACEFAFRKIRGSKTVNAILPMLTSDDAQIRNISMDVLREIGVDDIAAMQTYLDGDDADLRIFITDILGHCKNHQSAVLLGDILLKDPEVNVRYQAAVSLGNLAFPESVDALCKAMQDEEWVQFAVVEALSKIKEASAITAMVTLLPKSSMLVSSAIVDALGEIGDIKTISLLFNALENVNTAMRHKIVKAIVQILSEKSLSLLPKESQDKLSTYLLDALSDNDEDIQFAALQGLSTIGNEHSTEVIMDLAVTIDPDTNTELYEEAIKSIASIGYNNVIRDALRSEDEHKIMVAMEACQLMDSHQALDEIKQLFWRVGPELQRAAVTEVAQLGDCSDMPFFLSIMDESSDSEVLKNALIFFGHQTTCPDVEDIIFNQLDHQYPDVREMALEACINLHSHRLNERFRKLSASDDATHRMMAIYALGRYNVQDNIMEITTALEDEDPGVRRVAVEAFLNIGTNAERYLPRLQVRMRDENKDVRLALVDLFGEIGSISVMPYLLNALNDENDWVRIRAIDALAKNRIAEAVPTMEEMLKESNPMVIFKIIEALGKIGGNAAFTVLLGLMEHENQEIKHAAADAVAAIQAGQE